MRKNSVVLSAFALIFFLFLTACGSGSKPIAVSLTSSSSSTTIPAGTSSVLLTATVSNDTKDAGVTWNLSPSTGCGTLTTTATTATYYPPSAATLNADCPVTITAISASDSTKTTTVTLTIKAITVSVTGIPSSTTLGSGAKAVTLTATLNNEATGAVDTVTWSLSSAVIAPTIRRANRATPATASASCGTLTPNGTSANVSTATYTPPSNLGANCTATITAASTINSHQTSVTTFTVDEIVLNVTAPTSAVTEFAHAGNIALTATVTNDGANNGAGAGVNWTLVPGSCGTISQTGTSLTAAYVPPLNPATQCTATALATSVTDYTKSATTALITINPNIAVAWSPQPPSTVSEGAPLPLTASITNDIGKGLSWSISPLTGCGKLSATSGTTVTYTAPSPLTSTCTATVTVASVADPTFAGASAQASIAVNPTVIANFTPSSPQSVASSTLVPLSATVNYDGGNKGITWTITPTAPATSCGSLSATTGTSVNYTAPSEAALTLAGGACTATISAAPTADLTKTQSVAITANPISVSAITSTAMTLPATVGQSSNPAGIPLSATISYDTGGGIIWSGTGGCGTFVVGAYNASTGVAQAAFTPATSVASNCAETITVASMADGSKKATTTITVTPLTVSITTPSGAANVNEGSSQSLVATVTGGGTQAQSVNWFLVPSPSTGCGSLAFASGLTTTPNTFYAPNPPVPGCTATITAQSVTDTSKTSIPVVLTVVPPAISVSLTNQGPWFIDASNNNGSSMYAISGTITNDFGTKGVNLTTSNLTCGSIGQIINPGGASGVFSAVFTAVADSTLTTGSNCVTTITATSNADSTKVQVATLTVYPISINITPGGNQNYVTGSPNVTFSATVNNDAVPGPRTSGAGVAWSLSPSGCGLINNQTLTSVTFVPPASGSPSCNTQLIATSNADPNKSNFDSISVNPPGPALSIDPTQNGSIPSGVVGQIYQLSLNAQGGVTPYASFTTASGSIPPGLSYSTTSNSLVGTPTVDSGTYPHTYTFTVSVKDAVGTIATSPSVSVTIGAAPNHQHDSWLNGRYVCLTKGFIDNSGSPFPWASLSSIPFTGTSTVTGGIFDMAYGGTATGAGLLNSGTLAGTVNIGADNHGILSFTSTLTGSNSNTTTWAVEVNNVAGTTATEFHAIEIDDIGPTPSGQHGDSTCYQANTTVFNLNNVAGQSFAFAVAGTNAGGLAKDSIGVVSLSRTGQTVTGGNVDNAKGDGTNSGTTGNSVSSGTSYTTPDSATGRFVVTVTAGSNIDNMYVYTIDASRAVALAVSSNPSSVDGMQSGNVRKQLNGPYSNASLNGPFVTYYHSKTFTGSSPVSVVGYSSTLIQGTGDGTAGVTTNIFYQDQAAVCTSNCSGTLVANQTGSFLVPVASNGRAAFNPNSSSTGSMYLYMYDNNAALFMDATGSSQGNSLGIGWVDSQTATTSTNIAGTYVMFNMSPSDPNADNSIGMLTAANGNVTGTNDSASQGWFTWDESLSDNGGSITYVGPGTYGLITITQTGSTKGLECVDITTTKFACISGDDRPNINIMVQ